MRKVPGFLAASFGLIIFCFFLAQKSGFSQDTIRQKEPGYVLLAGGIYSCLDLWASTGFMNFQIQPGARLWVLQPQAGMLVSYTGACMVYGGLTYPATPVKWLVIQTGAAVGFYDDGKGIHLGYPVEFRLSLSVLFRFRDFTQVGCEFAHISNANMSTHNPGTESLSIIFQLPMRHGKAW